MFRDYGCSYAGPVPGIMNHGPVPATLTGPIGARTNRPVALVTDDFRLYHILVPLFESHGVNVLGLRPGEVVPEAVEVLLGGPADDPRTIAIDDEPQGSLLAVLAALDPRPTARGGYHEVVFGIDPGESIGLAFVADGQPLFVDQVFDPKDAVERLIVWRRAVTAESWKAHIGDGAPTVGVRLEGLIHKLLDGVAVRFVPEQETSPGSPATGSRHTDAAILIALRRPVG